METIISYTISVYPYTVPMLGSYSDDSIIIWYIWTHPEQLVVLSKNGQVRKNFDVYLRKKPFYGNTYYGPVLLVPVSYYQEKYKRMEFNSNNTILDVITKVYNYYQEIVDITIFDKEYHDVCNEYSDFCKENILSGNIVRRYHFLGKECYDDFLTLEPFFHDGIIRDAYTCNGLVKYVGIMMLTTGVYKLMLCDS